MLGSESNLKIAARQVDVALLTGCQDRHYAFGLAMALAARGIRCDVIGSHEEDCFEFHEHANVKFLNLRGNRQAERTVGTKLFGWLLYYVRLIRYAAERRPRVLHILWNNKCELIDRTLLMLFYRLCGRKLVLTAHNINQARRDSTDTFLNRITLRTQYQLTNQIFVHTRQMKQELCTVFGVPEEAVTVISYGINNAVPNAGLTCGEAKQRAGVGDDERTILFFGGIKAYKGLEYLVEAFQQLSLIRPNYRLIIAGERKKGAEEYFDVIQRRIMSTPAHARVIQKIQYIADEDTEMYFKAADVIALPYKQIYQSGILFLAYSFGLPAVATDVGCFREDIIEGRTGFLCKPDDPVDLARVIAEYFESDLFKGLSTYRRQIQALASARHSWDRVAEITRNVYGRLLADDRKGLD
jgi:glycosyltransferase involved in cell wall biosynthesis